MRYVILCALGSLLLSHCDSAGTQAEKLQEETMSPASSWMEKVFNKEEILSTYIGQDLEDFIARKAPVTVIEGEEYSIEGNLENGIPFSFYVSVDNGRIYEMNLDLFPDPEQVGPLFQELLSYIDTLYHHSHPTDGYATWRRSSARGSLVEVTLADVSLEMQRPTVMINQLEHEDRKYED